MVNWAFLCMKASSNELPKNGPVWHEIREVALPDILHVTTEFNSLLKVDYVAYPYYLQGRLIV